MSHVDPHLYLRVPNYFLLQGIVDQEAVTSVLQDIYVGQCPHNVGQTYPCNA